MDTPLIRHALIMAAGRGNRMRPLTDNLPKPMIPYQGDTLIGNSLKMLAEKILFVHVTVGYKKAMLAQYLMEKGVDTVINTEGHGNAWWISNTVMQYIDEPIVVLTTDNITEIDIDFLAIEYQRLNHPACMLVPVTPIEGIEGDYITHQDGLVSSVNRQNKTNIYCSGIQMVNPKLVASICSGLDGFYQVWEKLISVKKLCVSNLYPKLWFSIDSIDQLAVANGNNSSGK